MKYITCVNFFKQEVSYNKKFQQFSSFSDDEVFICSFSFDHARQSKPSV